jgi:hypothetical protein
MGKLFSAYLGIDVSIGPKPVTFVALDEDQQALAIGEGDVADALAYAAGQTGGALAAVNSAAHPNRGRMARDAVRRSLKPAPPKGRFLHLRQVEYELIRAGIAVPETPGSPERSLPWVRRGFLLVEKLEGLGYQPFPLDAAETPEDEPPPAGRQWLETQADAAFWSLLGVAPLPAGTLEGRIQRQLALLDEDLRVPDAMVFFEEITRFKILKSNLPTRDIFSQAEINAWVAAHTAWLADNQPERTRRYGESEEGFVYLPCKPG